MRTLHNIVPKQKRLNKVILQIRLHFWIKGYISCTHYDRTLNKELSGWPDGLTFFIQVLSSDPLIGLRKDNKGLHIIKSNQLENNSVILLFKSPIMAHEVFSGKTAIQQTLTEKKLIIKGDPLVGLFVLRSVMLVQNTLFPKLNAKRSLKVRCKKYLDRFKICTGIFLTRKKEAFTSDTEVLRIFE